MNMEKKNYIKTTSSEEKSISIYILFYFKIERIVEKLFSSMLRPYKEELAGGLQLIISFMIFENTHQRKNFGF